MSKPAALVLTKSLWSEKTEPLLTAVDKELNAITVSVSSDVRGSVTQTANTFTSKAQTEDEIVFLLVTA